MALLVSVLAQRKDGGWLKRHPWLTVVGANVFMVAMGLLFYNNLFSLHPIFGVLFETSAIWLEQKKQIR